MIQERELNPPALFLKTMQKDYKQLKKDFFKKIGYKVSKVDSDDEAWSVTWFNPEGYWNWFYTKLEEVETKTRRESVEGFAEWLSQEMNTKEGYELWKSELSMLNRDMVKRYFSQSKEWDKDTKPDKKLNKWIEDNKVNLAKR